MSTTVQDALRDVAKLLAAGPALSSALRHALLAEQDRLAQLALSAPAP